MLSWSESFPRSAKALPGIGTSVRPVFLVAMAAGLALAIGAPAQAGAAQANVKKARPPAAAQPAAGQLVTTDSGSGAFRLKSNALSMPMLDVSRFAFTAPGRITNSRVQPVERGFNFTPSGSSDRKALSLGITTRTLASATPGSNSRAVAAPVDAGLAPSGYGLDVSVGWKGFALSGGVSKADQGVGAGGVREGIDIGLSYASRNWKTSLQASAERGAPLLATPLRSVPGPVSERIALEAGTALALSPALSVGGSFRYRLAPLNPTPVDPKVDDRAVFLGGALAF